MKNNIVVLKFGGTSMGSAETIQECMEVIKERIKQKVHPFVVVSAISKMTNTLLEMLNLAKNGKKKELITIFKDIKQRHLDIISQLTKNKTLLDKYNKLINEKFDYLNKMLDGILLLGDYSDKNQALICSFGEDLSSDLMELCLTENKISAEKIHSKELVKTNGDYLSADVDFTKTKLAFKKVKENAKKIVFVMTGFFGSNQDKEIMLLGRGGSDFSASIAGIALEADMVEIWTDANGIMTADPRIVKTAKTWNKMNKDIASEMARAGAKVIHPKTISASHYGIPVIIKNLFNKSFKGTLINSEKCNSGVNGIVSDDGYSIIHFENPDMFEGVGYIAKLGLIASENNIPLDMAATSETSVSFTIKSNSLTNEALKYFEETANINVVNDVSKISIVGENINKMNILEKIFNTLNEKNINILMTSIGYSHNNIGIIVNKKDVEKTLLVLHDNLLN